MTVAHNKSIIWIGSVLLLLSVFAAVFYSEPALCFAPLVAIIVLLFIQYPRLLFFALLFSVPWSTEFNFTESLGTDLPDEPLMLLMAVAVIGLLLIQRKHEQQIAKPHLLLILLFASFAWSAVAVVGSTHFQLSIKYLLAKGWYMLAFVGAPLMLKGDEKLIKNSAIVLFVSMILATCVVMVRHSIYDFAFVKINDALQPFFRNHVNYSALLVFMVPLQLSFLRLTKDKTHRFFIQLSLFTVLIALLLSYARGAWLALLAGLAAYWLIKRRWLLKAFVLAVFLVGSLTFWLQKNENYLLFSPHHDITIFHEDFGEHLLATYQGKDVSTAERFYRWVAGARMANAKWLTGFGPTTFNEHYQSYAVPAFRTWVSENKEHSTVHNYFLLLLIEQGIPGLLFFLLLLGALFWQAQRIYHRTDNTFWKTTAAAVASILWMQCTVNFLSDLIETDKVGSVFYLCLAVLVIADKQTRTEGEISRQESVS